MFYTTYRMYKEGLDLFRVYWKIGKISAWWEDKRG
jgi:hypothetical protein